MWTTQVVRFGLHLVLILVFLGGSFLSLGHAKRERAVKSSVSRQTQISPKALRPAALATLKPGRKILLPWFDGKQLGATTKKRVQPRRGLVHRRSGWRLRGRDPPARLSLCRRRFDDSRPPRHAARGDQVLLVQLSRRISVRLLPPRLAGRRPGDRGVVSAYDAD